MLSRNTRTISEASIGNGLAKFLRIALFVSLLLSVLVPIIYWGGFLYPFITIRAFFFRIIVSLAVALFALGAATGAVKPRFEMLKKPVMWLPAGFLVWSVIASLFGIDFYHSFWSSFGRMGGLVSLLYLVTFFYLLCLSFREREWHWFFKAAAIVSLVVSLSALLQKTGSVVLSPLADIHRVGGLIDNAAFLASYLSITSFLALLYAVVPGKVWERWFFGCIAGIDFIAILVSATRGAAVGLVAALFVGIVLLSIYKPKVRRWGIGVLVLFVLIIAGGFVFRNSLQHSGIEIVSRLASISNQDVDTQSRLYIWEHSLTAVQARPLTGYGVENFEYVYNKMYDPTVLVEDWFDRSHNAYLDELVQTGVLGFLIFISLFMFAGLALYRLSKKDPRMAFVLVLLFVAYAVQDFFVFDTLNSSFLFFALIAFLFSSLYRDASVESRQKPPVLAQVVLIVFGLAAVAGLFWTVVEPFRANQALAEAYLYQVVDVPRSLTALDRGLSYHTFADLEYGYQSYDMYFVRNDHASDLTKDELKQSYDFTVSLLKKLINKYPWNARLYVYLAHVIDQRPAGETIDGPWFTDMLQQGIDLSPKRAQLYYTWANFYLKKADALPAGDERTHDFSKAIDILETYANSVPQYDEPQLILADILHNIGRTDESLKYFQKGLAVYNGDVVSAQRIASVYLKEQKYTEALPYLERIAKAYPDDDNAQFDLAKVYYLTGNIDGAVEVLNNLQAKKSSALSQEPAVVNQILNAYNNER